MRKLILAVALLSSLAPGAAALGPAASLWPMAFGGSQHASSTTATGPARPKLEWMQDLGGSQNNSASSISLDENENIYLIHGSTVMSFTPAGALRWKTDLTGVNSAETKSQPAITNDGRVILSTESNSYSRYGVSLSTADGSVHWSGFAMQTSAGNRGASPTLGPGGFAYFAGGASNDGYGCCGGSILDIITSSGTLAASLPRAGFNLTNLTKEGALSLDGATYYFLDSANLFAVTADTAGYIWSVAVPSPQGVSVGPDGTIVTTGGGGVRAFNPDGSSKWSRTTIGVNTWGFPASISGTSVYVSSTGAGSPDYDKYLIALDLATGGTLWSVDVTTSLFMSSPCTDAMCMSSSRLGPITYASGKLIFSFQGIQVGTMTTSGLAAFDATNGARSWASPAATAFNPHQVVPTSTRLYHFDGRYVAAFAASLATTFTVSASSLTLVPGSSVTLTAVVRDGGNAPVSGVGVVFRVSTGIASPMGGISYTNAAGQAWIHISSSSLNSSVVDSTITVSAFCDDFPPVHTNIHMESESIDRFSIVVPTQTPIGVPFAMTVYALNAYDHGLPSFPGTNGPVTVNLSPFLAGTQVAGSGSFGVTSVGISNGTGTIANQTYNKIESIQAKAAQTSPGVAVGLSTSIAITGPDNFIITMPTGTTAGQSFPVTITAVNGSTQVAGYSATLALSAVVWDSTATNATGSLGVTSVNLPPTGQVTINTQSFDRGAGIRIRAYDSALGVQGYSSSMTVVQPALTISHYSITAPTQVTVGLPFSFQVNALDASSAPVAYTLSRNITVQTFLNGTAISGSGSLGLAAMTLQAGSTYTYTASQTYNKIETIQIKVTDEDGRNVTSGPILFSGPTQFDVTMPTAAPAGTPFQIVVVARDAGNNQVLGYNGTVNIAAVQASNTALSGAGTLGVTSLNIASGLGTSAFQTYTKAEGLRLRVSDSAIGVTSYSSSATVRAGTPSSITLLANPQSTIAGVPSVLTATVYDAYTNPVTDSTATFSVATGSGVVSLSLAGGSVVSAVTSTQAVTDAFGQATAFFSSTNTLSAQANLLRASLGSLARDTTVYSSVLITAAGGAVVNFSNPSLRLDCPANTWATPIRMSLQGKDELPAADLALATAAFAATANTFVSTTVLKISAVRDSSPSVPAGAGSKLVTVSMPYAVTSGSISVGAYGAQSILVPLSVMRIFKLNQTSSVFEQVIDGVTAVNSVTGVVTAEVSDPDGIYALGAPAFVSLTAGATAAITTPLAGGTSAEVIVPAGGFAEAATISVTVPSASAVPALPARPGLTALGVTISVTAGGLQPASPVTIKIGYTPAAVAGVNPDHLRLARYDATTGWVVLDSAADTATRQVVGTTDHFSLFQIVAQTPGATVADGFVFPNPFRPSRGHTNIKLSSLPAGAKVKIFTSTGRLLKELDADASGQVLNWNGTDRDGRALASGVYLAVIEGGGGRRTIKFAVQR